MRHLLDIVRQMGDSDDRQPQPTVVVLVKPEVLAQLIAAAAADGTAQAGPVPPVHA